MKYVVGNKYGLWVFENEYCPGTPSAICHLCGKRRSRVFRFEIRDSKNEPIEYTELGTECVKNFDFNQSNPYTNKAGVNTAL